jgi:hypothetical protein
VTSITDNRMPWDTVDARADDAAAAREAHALSRPVAAVRKALGGGGVTIPMMCLGIALIAACLLVPAADDVRRLAYERDRLRADLEQLHEQVQTNDAFLKRVADDATLAERLARRQMKMVPEGTAVLELSGAKPQDELSPFLLVTVPPPAPMAEYRPVGGMLAAAVQHPKTQLYLIGASLMMIAAGLVLSRSPRPTDAAAQAAEDGAGEG